VKREKSLKRRKLKGAGGGFAASNTAARAQLPSRDKSPEVAAQHCGRVPVKTGRGREAGRNSRRAGSARNRRRLSWRRKTPKGHQNLKSVIPIKNGKQAMRRKTSGGRRKLADESEATPIRGIPFARNPEDESVSRITFGLNAGASRENAEEDQTPGKLRWQSPTWRPKQFGTARRNKPSGQLPGIL